MLTKIQHFVRLCRFAARKLREPEKRSPKWRKVEEDFLAKFPTCRACGTINRLNVHHKKPFHLFPELELDEKNLITLCMYKDCHLLIGHGDNFRAYNPNVEQDVENIRNKSITLEQAAANAKKNRVFVK